MNTRAEGSLSRLSGRLLVFVWAALLLGATAAKAAPVETMVQDILYRADGQVAHGMITIRWNAFSTGAGEAVPSGEKTVTIGRDGSISIPLIANTGSSPAGSYYRVFLKLDDGTTSEEQWVVPAAATTTVAAVRAKVVPQAAAVQFVSRDYVDSSIAAMGSTVVHEAGAETITGVKTFAVSPEVPAPADAGSAADKGYVDQQIAGLATVAATGNYNDLVNKPAGANLASPGPIGATTPSTVNATDSISKTTPAVDIRAYGAVIDGATDIGPALAAATAQACTTLAPVLLPCGGSGCYLANGTIPQSNGTACSTNGHAVQYKLQGKLIMGSTLVAPDKTDWVCDGGLIGTQFTAGGPSCTVTAPQANGSIGTAISTVGSAVTFTPTFTTGSISNLQAGSAITVAETASCNISTITRTSASLNNVTATLSSPQCRIPAGSKITVAGVTDSSYNTTPILITSDYPGGVMTWTQSGIASVTVNSGGSGYTSAPAVSISGGGCVSVTATATISGGAVTAVNITNSGDVCTSTPAVSFSGGGGSGATATAALFPAGSSTGGTVTGLNEATFETVVVTANDGTHITATFAHTHPSTALFGAVGIMEQPDSFSHHYFKGINVVSSYGAGWEIANTATTMMDGVGATEKAALTSIPIELASTWDWRITNSAFVTAGQYGCGSNCMQTGYPYGMRITSFINSGNGSNLNAIVDGDTFIVGGIKMDENGLGMIPNCGAGNAECKMGELHLRDVTIEQPVSSAVMIDTEGGQNLAAPIYFNNVFLQDNFYTYPTHLIGYTDPITTYGQGAVINGFSNVFVGAIGNQYYGGPLLVNGMTDALALPRYLGHVGTINDGVTTETEFRGEGANLGPQIIPFATQNVTTNPASWTTNAGGSINTGIEAPDGTMTAGELVTGATANPWITVESYTVTPQVGDWIISGVWCMPGVNNPNPCTAQAQSAYMITSGVSTDAFDNTNKYYAYPSNYTSNLYNDWWHPIVSANEITTATATPHQFVMSLYGANTSGEGVRFWMPFFIYIPVSAKPASMTTAQWDGEVARWRQWLMHGAVPPGMPASVLAINPSLKMYWGNDTNLYRGAAGVVQSDGSFNANGGGYQVSGATVLPSTLTGYNGNSAGVKVPLAKAWTTPGSAELVCHDTNGDLTDTGCPSSASSFPQMVASIAPTTTTAGTAQTTIFTPSAAGQFRMCGYTDVTVAATAGQLYPAMTYTSDGHTFSSVAPAGVPTAATQWTTSSFCSTFYSDAGQPIKFGISASSLTGTPTLRYAVTLEQLQ